MKPCLFDSFADMIGALPAAAVLRTLEWERAMLERDLARQRPSSVADISSILSFCWFIEAILQSWSIFPVPAPPRAHLEFYRTTLERLADAGELPFDAVIRFDETFYTGTHAPTRAYA
ncbi:MAG TPA: hypothetical protein VG347_21855 [Verrucomicrobiae bacterium]|nr:hypothetical protein [Verrucomicrobiae bacterium]